MHLTHTKALILHTEQALPMILHKRLFTHPWLWGTWRASQPFSSPGPSPTSWPPLCRPPGRAAACTWCCAPSSSGWRCLSGARPAAARPPGCCWAPSSPLGSSPVGQTTLNDWSAHRKESSVRMGFWNYSNSVRLHQLRLTALKHVYTTFASVKDRINLPKAKSIAKMRVDSAVTQTYNRCFQSGRRAF